MSRLSNPPNSPQRSDIHRNEQEITSVYAASAEDVDLAVKAARKALKDPSWKNLSSSDRGRLLFKLADLVHENAHTLATIETWDNGECSSKKWPSNADFDRCSIGKPFKHARAGDIRATAMCLRYYAGWADKIQGDVIETAPSKLTYTIREPVGVCGQIIP
jgi:aldehyde dehydrogenase (NAD+)